MLVICRSFLKSEFKPSERYFSKKHLIHAARKAKNGLGEKMGGMGVDAGELRKIYLTGRSGSGRVVFVINANDGLFIPVLLRTKNDIIGRNMTNKNSNFIRVFQKALAKIRIDLENDDFEIEKI